MKIKSFVKKILGYKSKTYSSAELYVASGNMVHGNNCNLDGLNILVNSPKKNHLNIKVGNDCYLACTIMLQSPYAEVIIGDGVFIGQNTTLFCYDKIVFENDIMVSWGCTFIDTNAHSLLSSEREADVRDWLKGHEYKNWEVVKHTPIHIKNKCWVGFNTIVTKGVIMEEGTVIGCGSVVTKTTQPYSVYGGNPAVFIKSTT